MRWILRPSALLTHTEHFKLLTSTPIKTYSEPVAAAVLSHYTDDLLVRATGYLCLKGVIAIGGKLHYKKRLPGRSYCYTDKWAPSSSDRKSHSYQNLTWNFSSTDIYPTLIQELYKPPELVVWNVCAATRCRVQMVKWHGHCLPLILRRLHYYMLILEEKSVDFLPWSHSTFLQVIFLHSLDWIPYSGYAPNRHQSKSLENLG
jgi:hypothetical protein